MQKVGKRLPNIDPNVTAEVCLCGTESVLRSAGAKVTTALQHVFGLLKVIAHNKLRSPSNTA